MSLSQSKLMELFVYDPETGDFIWRVTRRGGRNNAFVFSVAGEKTCFLGSFGYLQLAWMPNKRIAAHRAAWLYMTGELPPKGFDIDHVNGVRGDNRWVNLRLASRSQNMQNLKKAHEDNSTGFLGVEKKRQKFSARICLNRKKYSLGSFDTAEEAHQAYLKAKRQIHEMGTL